MPKPSFPNGLLALTSSTMIPITGALGATSPTMMMKAWTILNRFFVSVVLAFSGKRTVQNSTIMWDTQKKLTCSGI